MQKIINLIFKVFAIIVHIIQAFVSDSAELYFSFTIAIILLGSYMFDIRTFKKLFLVPQWGASFFGSIVWLIVAIIEMPID